MAPKPTYERVGASIARLTAQMRGDVESMRLAVATSRATMADTRETIRKINVVLARNPFKISN